MSEFPLYIWEFVSRRDFLGIYLLVIGIAFAWFAARSWLTLEARGFGYRAPAVRGPAAARVAASWLAVALACLAGGLLVLEAPL